MSGLADDALSRTRAALRAQRRRQSEIAREQTPGVLVRCHACRHGHIFGSIRVGQVVYYREDRTDRGALVQVGARGKVTGYVVHAGMVRQDVHVRLRVGRRAQVLTFAPCELSVYDT